MKLITPVIITVLFVKSVAYSQSRGAKECKAKKEIEELLDLNSITKCDIKEVTTKSGAKETQLKISYRKIRKRIANKSKLAKVVTKDAVKGISKVAQQSLDNSFVASDLGSEKLKNLNIQEVLFSVVDEIPLFKKCYSDNVLNKKLCFNKEMSKHFAENFYPERASEDGINGRIFIQFVIDFEGKVKNIEIKTKKKSKLLEKEIKRVILKLPKFLPGSHKSLPVNTKYNLPINLTLE